MKSSIPAPKIVIHRHRYTAESGGEYTGLIVDAQITPEVSNGYIFLDAPEHLFILRDAVDAAIARLNITRPEKAGANENQPTENETHSEDETA